MITPTARRWLSAWALLGPVSCVDGAVETWPTAPEPTRSHIYVRQCGFDVFAWASDGGDAPPPLTVEPCERELVRAIAFFDRPLAELGYEPGRLVVGPCPASAGRRCTEEALSSPGAERLYSAVGAEPSPEWQASTSWPASIADLRFPRRNRCPTTRDRSMTTWSYQRFDAAFIDDERLVLMGEPPPPADGQHSLELYETSLTELLSVGLPDAPNRATFQRRGVSIQAGRDGTVFVGLREPPAILVVSPSGDQQLLPHGWADRSPMHLALRPGSEDAPEFAIRDVDFSAEIHLFGPAGWRHLNEPTRMEGRCTTSGGGGQRASISWKNADELLVLPNATGRFRPTSSSTITPDGYWHVVAGEPRWERVELHEPGDCLARVVFVPAMGLLAVTRAPRFYVQADGLWRERPPSGLQLGFDGGIIDIVPIEHGYAYTREGRRFGVVADGVLCEERALDNTDLNVILHRGSRLLVLGDAKREEGTGRLLSPSSIHVIDLELSTP